MLARHVRAATGVNSKAEGLAILYRRIEENKELNWKLNNHQYHLSGYDRKKDLVHFVCTEAVEGGGVWHSRVGLSMEEALASADGDLSHAKVLL